MTTTPREGMFDAFLSYSRKDAAFADRLRAELANAGKTVWLDREDILPAESWSTAAFQGISGSHNFLFLISPNSVAPKADGSPSPCRRELGFAVKSGKRLIPLHYRETPRSEIPAELSPLNDVDFRAAMQSEQAFAQAMQKLLSAIDTDAAWVRQKTILQLRANEWETQNRDASRLLRGEELRKFERWQSEPSSQTSPPTPLQTEFLLASRQDERRRQRRNQWLTTAAAVILLGLTAYAFVKRQEAIAQLRIASASRLAAEALNLRDRNVDLASLLSREAVEIDPTYDARNAELTLDQTAPGLFTHVDFRGEPVDATTVVFSPDAHRFAAIAGKRIGIWDATSRQRPWLSPEYPTPASQLAWSPQGSLLAARFGDATTKVWNVRTDKPMLLWSEKKQPAVGNLSRSVLAFNQPGTLLAIIAGGKIKIWSARDDQLKAEISPRGKIFAFAFLPGSPSRLAVLTGQGGLQIFAARDGAILSNTQGLFSSSTALSSDIETPLRFSRDGKQMAVLYLPTQVGLFRILSRNNGEAFKMVHDFPLHDPRAQDSFTAIAFSPDGKKLAAISSLGLLRQWSTTTFRPDTDMPDGLPSGAYHTLFYNAGGKLLVAGQDDYSELVEWSEEGLPYRVLRTGQSRNRIIALAWSAHGRYLAGGDERGAVYIWKSTQAQPLRTLPDDGALMLNVGPSIAFSSGHKTVWLGGGGGIHEIRDWKNHAAKSVAMPLHGFMPLDDFTAVSSRAAAFTSQGSQGGVHVIYADGKTSYLKDPSLQAATLNATGNVLAVRDSHGWSIWRLMATGKAAPRFQSTLVDSAKVDRGTLNASGTLFAGWQLLNDNRNEKMTIWNTSTGKPVRSDQALSGLTGASAAPPPSAQPYMAVEPAHGWPQILDIKTMSFMGLPLPTYQSQTLRRDGLPLAMSYSPDGKWLAYGDLQGNVWLWDADPSHWAERVCRVAGRNLSKAEWSHYIGKAMPYQKTCPQYPPGVGEK